MNPVRREPVLHEQREIVDVGYQLSHSERATMLEEATSALRHDLRNRFATIRNAQAYIRKKLGASEAWAQDTRLEIFSKLIDEELFRAQQALENLGCIHPSRQERDWVDVSDCVVRALGALRLPPSARARLTLRLVPATVSADAHDLAVAIRALIENALESGPPPIPVAVETRVEGRVALAIVSDEGPGIAASDWEQALRPFFSTKDGHLGLGLNIARRVAQRHGGRVAREFDTGNGFSVVLSLPLAEG